MSPPWPGAERATPWPNAAHRFVPLVTGTWIERRKRFMLDVTSTTADRSPPTPNTAHTGLTTPGARVLLSASDNARRRYATRSRRWRRTAWWSASTRKNPTDRRRTRPAPAIRPIRRTATSAPSALRQGRAIDLLVTTGSAERTLRGDQERPLVETPARPPFPLLTALRQHLDALADVVRARQGADGLSQSAAPTSTVSARPPHHPVLCRGVRAGGSRRGWIRPPPPPRSSAASRTRASPREGPSPSSTSERWPRHSIPRRRLRGRQGYCLLAPGASGAGRCAPDHVGGCPSRSLTPTRVQGLPGKSRSVDHASGFSAPARWGCQEVLGASPLPGTPRASACVSLPRSVRLALHPDAWRACVEGPSDNMSPEGAPHGRIHRCGRRTRPQHRSRCALRPGGVRRMRAAGGLAARCLDELER